MVWQLGMVSREAKVSLPHYCLVLCSLCPEDALGRSSLKQGLPGHLWAFPGSGVLVDALLSLEPMSPGQLGEAAFLAVPCYAQRFRCSQHWAAVSCLHGTG